MKKPTTKTENKKIKVNISAEQSLEVIQASLLEEKPISIFNRNFSSNKEVFNEVSNICLNFGLENLKKEVAKTMVFMDSIVESIWTGFVMGENVLLYGKAGHGKTDILKLVCNILKIPLNIKLVHVSSSVEHFLGIPDMKKLRDESRLEYAWHQTIFSLPGIIGLEEGLDGQGDTLSAMKDIITESGLRDLNNFFPSLASSFVITTNKDPQDYVTDESISAFVNDRFLHKREVKWPAYTHSEYISMFKVIFNEKTFNENKTNLSILSLMCEKKFNQGKMVTPRTAYKAAKQMLSLGLKSLNTYDFDLNDVKSFEKESTDKLLFNSFESVLISVKAALIIIEEKLKRSDKLVDICIILKMLHSIEKTFNEYKCPDKLSNENKNLINNLNSFKNNVLGKLINTTKITNENELFIKNLIHAIKNENI